MLPKNENPSNPRWGRAAAILFNQGKIALIERHRPRRHYFVLPGGGIETGETPEQAVVREVREELGLEVAVERLIALRRLHGMLEYYFLVQATGGQFGTGDGPEMGSRADTEEGSFTPIWMSLAETARYTVHPQALIAWLAQIEPDQIPQGVWQFEE